MTPLPSLNTEGTWGVGKVLAERKFGGLIVIDLLKPSER